MIALLCRFYGFSLSEVMSMTIRQFIGMAQQISEVQKIEMGENKEASLSGDAGFALARRILPRGRRR
jgi:hypothetical protein